MTNMLFSNKLMIIMSKENVNAEEAAISDTGKDIKKGMDRYEARIKSPTEGEAPPAGDSTRSEE
jgi:hypothetical protein